MVLLLGLVFVVVPLIELYVLIQVGHVIGALPTLALVLVVSLVGAWLVKREGLAVWRRFQQRVAAGQAPGRELVDGVLVLLAGALLLAPGLITDALGLLLLVPPVRAAVRAVAVRRLARRAKSVRAVTWPR